MIYHQRFGLMFNPFIKNSQESYISTEGGNEIFERLNYLANVKGFGLITGNPGVGKTTILRNWAKSLNKSLYRVVYISLSTLTVLDFYRLLAEELGCESYYRKSKNYRAIQNEIISLMSDKKITPVIILDEANYFSFGILNDLKMLFNFEMDSKDRAIVILTGLPVLNGYLSQKTNEPLRQRILMNYNLEPLSNVEAKKYISSKFEAAKGDDQVISAPAKEAIISASKGIPRLINLYIDRCMHFADSKELCSIDAELAMAVISDIVLD